MTASATTTTTKLPFVTIILIAFVAAQSVHIETNLTTEIPKPEGTTDFRFLKNETTDDPTIETLPTTHSTVQTKHSTATTTAEPKVVTFKQETSSKPVMKLRRSTTVKTTTLPNITVTSNVSTEPDQTAKPTTTGMRIKNSSETNAIRKSQPTNITTETVPESKPVTKPDSLKGVSLQGEEKPETTISTEETTFFQKPEHTTFSTEGRDMKKDPIEQELDDTINSMPELPELVLSNETHFKFHQDPEEASLDERITQIARQLAETGLRREYEERKLGHFIPISVRPIDYSSPSYHHYHKSKSIKFVKNDTPDLAHYKSTLLKVLTKGKSENLDKTTYELVTNLPEILKKNKSDKQIREMNELIKFGGKGFNSETTDNMFPTHFPIFFELLQTSEKGNSEPKPKSQSVATTTSGKHLTTRGRLTDDTTYYSYIETTDNS